MGSAHAHWRLAGLHGRHVSVLSFHASGNVQQAAASSLGPVIGTLSLSTACIHLSAHKPIQDKQQPAAPHGGRDLAEPAALLCGVWQCWLPAMVNQP
jgi:hypothetical protein